MYTKVNGHANFARMSQKQVRMLQVQKCRNFVEQNDDNISCNIRAILQ